MNRAQEQRLEELAEQKREIRSYQEQNEREFGPTAEAMLDFLNYYLYDNEHLEIDLVECQCGGCTDLIFETDKHNTGTDLFDLLKQMMKEEGK